MGGRRGETRMERREWVGVWRWRSDKTNTGGMCRERQWDESNWNNHGSSIFNGKKNIHFTQNAFHIPRQPSTLLPSLPKKQVFSSSSCALNFLKLNLHQPQPHLSYILLLSNLCTLPYIELKTQTFTFSLPFHPYQNFKKSHFFHFSHTHFSDPKTIVIHFRISVPHISLPHSFPSLLPIEYQTPKLDQIFHSPISSLPLLIQTIKYFPHHHTTFGYLHYTFPYLPPSISSSVFPLTQNNVSMQNPSHTILLPLLLPIPLLHLF